MDLSLMLNDEAQPSTTRKPRHSSASQSRSSTLPALNTSISESPGVTRSLTAAEIYYPQSQSHEQHQHPPPPHPQAQYGHTYISGSPSQYQPSPATPSAYTHGNPASIQQPPILNRQFSHPSQISTPSSHPQTPHGLQQHSPISSRSISYHAPIQHAPPQSHSGTPMGERMYLSPQIYSHTPPVPAVPGGVPYPPQLHTPGPRQSMPRPPQLLSSGSRDSVPGYHHLSNDRGPGVPLTSMSPPAPPRPMYGGPPPYPRPQQSRHSSSMGVPSRERTHSVSVSPKTMVVDLPPSRNVSLNGSNAGQSVGAAPDRVETAGFAHPGSVGARSSSTTSNFLKDPTPQEKRKTARKSHDTAPGMSSPLTRMRSRDNPGSQTVVVEDPPSELSLPNHENVPEQVKSMAGVKRALDSDPVQSSQPPVKKRRGSDIPIWAQQAKNTAPLPKYRHNGPANGKLPQRPAPAASVVQPIQAQLPRAVAAADRATAANLEDSILGVVPMDEVHKTLCDFLFEQVVVNNAFGTLHTGQAAPSSNLGVVEIEAKLGTVLDRHTNERISTGALTETVVSSGPSIAFESMMTEEQHAAYNKMLNDAVAESMGMVSSASAPQRSQRVPIEYVHRHEIDSFYPLPQEDIQSLPPAIIGLNRARNLNVRVTKDQKTGATLAQIVKVRLADVHVHSPRSAFDWRVSVNAEVQWSGNVAQLMAEAKKESHGKAQPDRRKDRMSYKHQFCQVDLTQVKAVAGVGNDKATHELEVELDAAELREQGQRILSQAPNCYEPLVRTLVNNVRLLVRKYAYT